MQPPATGQENYQCLTNVWQQKNKRTLENILRWCNNKDAVPMLEAMQKMVALHHQKGIGMLKLGCTLPILANIRSHNSISAKFYPLTEGDMDLLGKIRDEMDGWWIIYSF